MLTLKFKDIDKLEREVGITFFYEDGKTGAFLMNAYDKNDKVPLAEGWAYTNTGDPARGIKPDQFSKKVGRKLAFQRAVEAFTNGGTDESMKRIRRELWAGLLAAKVQMR